MTPPPLIVCPQCTRPSWNPNDADKGYCGYCHWWTSDPVLGPLFSGEVRP